MAVGLLREVGVVGTRITLGIAISQYLSALAAGGCSGFYIRAAGYSLRLWTAWVGSKTLSLAMATLSPFLAHRYEALSHNSAAVEFHRYRQFLDYCVGQGWLDRNPLRAFKAPRRWDTDVEVLTDGQLRTLLLCADQIEATILIVLLGSGMRLGELARLRWADIRADELIVCGKGDKVRRVAPGKLAMQAIMSLPRTHATVMPFGRAGIDYHLRHLAKRAGIPIHAHQLRHTFADHFIRSGGGVEDLAHILGHCNLQTTLIYIRRHQQERALLSQRKYNAADALLADDGRVVPFRGR